MKEKLKAISSDEKSDWVARAKEKLANTGARRNARKLALRVLALLEKKAISQTELAEKMGVSRQRVGKIVKGKENFTFETVAKLEEALGVTLLSIEEGNLQPRYPSEVNIVDSNYFISFPNYIYWTDPGLLLPKHLYDLDRLAETTFISGALLPAPHHGKFEINYPGKIDLTMFLPLEFDDEAKPEEEVKTQEGKVSDLNFSEYLYKIA
jgi:transcriptional regulator with XRE-family HTH domain